MTTFDLEYIIEEGVGRMILLIELPGGTFERCGPFPAKDAAAREIPDTILARLPQHQSRAEAAEAYVARHMLNMNNERNTLGTAYPLYISVKPKEGE